MIEPETLKIASSDGRQIYEVVTPTIFNDGVCTCPDYEFRGDQRACKHILAVRAALCLWHTEDLEQTHCKLCGKELRTIDLGG